MDTIQILAVGGTIIDPRIRDFLQKFSHGTFKKNKDRIDLTTTDNIVFKFTKDKIIEETDSFVKYLFTGDKIDIPDLLLTHYFILEKQYILGGVKPNSYNITFFHRQAIPSWQLLEYEKNGMKMKRLKGIELTLLSEGISRGLFPAPKTGQCLASKRDLSNFEENAFYIYFDHSYFKQLVESINNHFLKGSFANSNIEKEWLVFKSSIESSNTVFDFELNKLNIYSLSIDYPDSEE